MEVGEQVYQRWTPRTFASHSPVSRQSEKFLIGQSRKFLLTAARLEGWNESR
jgi:hypothetical protein